MPESITITDATIVKYFNENPHLDIVTMNHIFINILKNLSSNLSSTINSTTNAEILSIVKGMNGELSKQGKDMILKIHESKKEYVEDIKTMLTNSNLSHNDKLSLLLERITNLSNNINSTTNAEILSVVKDIKGELSKQSKDMIVKMHESKKEYMEDVKTLLTNSNLTHSDKLSSLLERNTEALVMKTANLLNDVIPKNQTIHYKQVETTLKEFYNNISVDTKKLLENTKRDDSSLKDFMGTIDTQFNTMVSSLQQPIYSFISASEERMNTSLSSLKESAFTQTKEQERLTNELLEFLNRYKNNSSVKGSISENILYNLLQNIFPSDEIIDCRSNTASGDFIVKRLNKTSPTIMFENKDYKNNVNTEEVDKFVRDVQLKKCHGIFLSQFSPITYKKNFQIDICNGFICVYIPNAGYDIDKIKTAIDIIDNLSLKLNVIEKEYTYDAISIPTTDIDAILEEYHRYGIKRLEMIEFIKNTSKQMIDNMEELTFPCLRKTLIAVGKEEHDSEFKCTTCNQWSGKNKASLAAHMRKCKATLKAGELQEPLNLVIPKSNGK